MTTNKERIEILEQGVGGLQDEVQRLGLGMNDRMQRLEESLKALSDVVLSSKADQPSHSSHSVKQGHTPQYQHEETESSRLNIPPLRTKIEFPRFAGDDPTEWFNRVAQFFEFQRTLEDQKVSLAAFHMEGEANQWWQWLNRTYKEENRTVTWTMFADELWARFGPTDGEDFDEALSHIKQSGSLRDYQREFEKLGNRAISLARTRDEQLTRQRRFACPIPPNRPAAAVTSINQRTSIVPKRLGWEEMQKRRAQGLCFNCNERFTPGHKCQGPRLLLIEDHDEVQDKEEEAKISDNREDELEVSIHALTGWASPRTMRVAATIKSQPIMVLIDSGSTHNFLSDKVARTLRLPVVPTKSFTVHVANGERLLCQGRFEKVPIDLQGIPFSLTCYSLPLAGLDMVLGIQWLKMLGSVVCNWQYLTMDFNWENQARRLQGIQGPIQATSLRPLQRSTDKQILGEFEDVFQEPFKLPPLREIDHHIPLKEGTQPINVRPYRYAYFQKAEIEKQVQAMLDVGIIRPSTSPYSSPVLLVKKKDDTWRFCTDYRALNAATIKDRFPIPTVDDMLDELYGATYFTKLDLRAGYHQVRVHAPDIPKTAFRTHNGHFEYLVMPFGLFYSPTWELHLNHVRKTLEILKKHSFFVKATKYDFGKQELEYLGHIVTNHGVKVDGKKIEAMIAWPQPTTITELRGFLGLTGYYRKFVRNYGVLARPLTNLLKKGNFKWDEDAAAAFTMLKQALTTTPTLAMPNFNEPFTIETDASGDGIGAVLTQQGRPIAYMIRALGVTKRSWSIYAKEMLAIVEAIRTWRPYILGRKFFIRTDQRSLKYFLEQRVATSEQQKWVAKLLGYDYEIIYRPGRENSTADALSRRPNSPLLNPIFISQVSLWDDIRKAATTDLYMKKIFQQAAHDPTGHYEFHDSKVAGHSEVLRTFKRLAQQFYWPSMYKNIQDYIQQCATCQKTKSETLAPAGLLQPLPIPCLVWDDISLDFIDGLPSSQGKDSIMVVVDRLSKYAHFIALFHPFSAKMIAEKFVENIIKLHGMPKSIISDRDPIFVSKFWQEFFTMSGTQLKLSSAYHPQTDGQTEVVNRCLEQYLRCFVHQWPRKWFSYLSWAEYWYNTTYHCSTGMTPFQALYGRLPPSIPHYADGLSRVNEVDQSLLTRDEVLQQLKMNLELAATRMKHVADQKRKEVEFQIGDLVLLKLHPYRQHSVFKRAHQKLANRFYGPFPVEQKLGKVAYRLSLPPEAKIHPVFHVSLLKKYVGTSLPALVDLPPISDEGQLQVTPEKVVNTRWIKRGTKFIEESLVQWKNLPVEDATWEDTQMLKHQFSTLNLEDKVPLMGGSIDTPRRDLSQMVCLVEALNQHVIDVNFDCLPKH
ncbi:Transposon Tf2-11 polyprotein [Vitis vinifera]|uniref:RNA-directed DNA polymerase n=1 Tax=Vitis vinifera TaxID=29760 RepID=A0A438D842_VITVI|nr:Transposon Tf2-11 polyprotein [Vitis vinifera]